MNALEKLRVVVDELKAGANPTQTQPNWDLAGRLVSRFAIDPDRVRRTLRTKDIDELDAIVRELETPASASGTGPADVSEGTKSAALKAFKKRLKVSRLADESKLGGRYTSGGKKSRIDAMQPPSEFDPAVWKALVADGKLRDVGGGFYAEP